MPDKDFETIQECRGCSSRDLVDILDLGIQPLANALVKDSCSPVKKFPLTTAFCPKCSLFQLKETVRKEILFDHYVWVTGTSKGAREYATLFAKRAAGRVGLKPLDFVLEIASNDGTILKQFMGLGMKVLGIEPARNVAAMATEEGVPTQCCYWDLASAQKVVEKHGRPRVIIARNVIAHVSDLHSVIDGFVRALDDDGVGIIEFHNARAIAQELHYDSIYHEHLCYFSIHSLGELLRRHGLYPFAADVSPISGGSIVLFFSKKNRRAELEYLKLLELEQSSGINEQDIWEKFASKVKEHREKTLAILRDFKGKTIVGFGASARSSTFIIYCDIGKNYFQAIIDNNPIKQGLMTPAGDVPIVSFDQGMALKPDVIFILAWNFSKEIMDECEKRGFTGQYIVPFPLELRVLSSQSGALRS